MEVAKGNNQNPLTWDFYQSNEDDGSKVPVQREMMPTDSLVAGRFKSIL